MAPAEASGLRELNRATLARQGLLEPMTAPSAGVAVERLGSLQAQHPEWPPVALAARAADAATADLAAALRARGAVRSSLMRITIHVVTADDLWPMFTVCQPLRLDQWRLLLKADPVDSPLARRMRAAHQVAIAALRERPRSSLELDRLMAAEVGPGATRRTRPAWRQPESQIVVRAAWRHFAAFVPLVHVPHEREGYGRSLYVLAEDWLGTRMPDITLDEARRHVARRYLAAFGPASVEDLAAYVGRGKGGLRAWGDAIKALGDEVVAVHSHDGRTLFDLADSPRPESEVEAPPRFLARWDSLLLSHAPKARERVIAAGHRERVFTKNADVRPTFLVDGFVAGTWNLSRGDGVMTVKLEPFAPLRRKDREALIGEGERVLALLAPDSARAVEVAA